MTVCQAIVIFTLPLINSKGMYLIWILLSYLFYGGHFSIFPTITAKLYGTHTAGKIYTCIYSGFAITTIIGVVLSKVILPMH